MIKQCEHHSLRGLNTMGIDVVADRYVSFDEPDVDLPALWTQGCFQGNFVVLGHGANVVFTADFHGTVVHPANAYIIIDDTDPVAEIKVGAGMLWDDVVAITVSHNLSGLENLSGIPADAGGAVVQNIGAYGAEISSLITSVRAFDTLSGEFVVFTADECGFAYRTSRFKLRDNKFIITDITLALQKVADPWEANTSYAGLRQRYESSPEDFANPEGVRHVVTDIRNSKLPDPDSVPNAGSFFKNPVVDKSVADSILAKYPDMPSWKVDAPDKVKLSGGWLIEKSLWKGRRLGPVGIDPRSALVVINPDGGSASDILRLVEAVTADVFSNFGIKLEPEVLYI